jgi:glycosyl hydrolase family 108
LKGVGVLNLIGNVIKLPTPFNHKQKEYIIMDILSIPDAIKNIIEEIIINDEGGWIATQDANDPGGFTFAGITIAVWQKYLPLDSVVWMRSAMTNNPDVLKIDAIQIYYQEYYVPLAHMFQLNHEDNEVLFPYELSCAVNCGVETAYNISISAALNKITFCHSWLLHYANLVRENAIAWQNAVKDPRIKHPATFRATYLAGWINRVMRYVESYNSSSPASTATS